MSQELSKNHTAMLFPRGRHSARAGDYGIRGTFPTFRPWPGAPPQPAPLTNQSIQMTPDIGWNPSKEARGHLGGCDHRGGSKMILRDQVAFLEHAFH